MRFAVLGPLECRSEDGATISLTSSKQRTLLAVLLCHRNQVISADRLIDALWGAEPPPSARANLQVYVHRLRKVLGESAIVHRQFGYELVARPGDVDADTFGVLAGEGRRLLSSGDPAVATSTFAAALDLWRGTPYGHVDGADAVQLETSRLLELRLAALEGRLQADLDLGRHAEVIPELTVLVAEHPLRERFRALLMTAMHRAGRSTDALAVYRQARTVMIEELGLEPSSELRDLERKILDHDPSLHLRSGRQSTFPGSPVARIVPAELPPPDPAFTGRHDDVAELTGTLARPEGSSTDPVIVAVDGAGGTGKSALALHVAHSVSAHYPDGSLYVNLRGATPGVEPLEPEVVLRRFLRAIGLDDPAIPGEVDEAAALFRSLTSARRLLIVLDDAAGAAQVRPLLPGTGHGSAVVVTSRTSLASLDAAAHRHLDGLSPDEAVVLLARLAGVERVGADPDAAGDIVGLCAHLPLAVRIAAARLAARSDWTLDTLRRRLSDARRRLDELQYDDLAVRSSCAISHHVLPDRAARLFDHLGLLDLADITPVVAAVLVDRPVGEVQHDLDRLAEAQLVSVADERYRLHDLVRLYARECAEESVDDADRRAAIRRVLHHYVATARHATHAIAPSTVRRITFAIPPEDLDAVGSEMSTGAEIRSWTWAERDNLLAVATTAARTPGDGPSALAALAPALIHPLFSHAQIDQILAINALALESAERSASPEWMAMAHHDVGEAWALLGRFADSRRHREESLALYRELGDEHGQSTCLSGLGNIARRQGDVDGAVDFLDRAITLFHAHGNAWAEANCLNGLGETYRGAGRFDEAVAACERALTIAPADDHVGRATVKASLGTAHLAADRPNEALRYLDEAASMFREQSNSRGHAVALWLVSTALQHVNRPGDAAASRRESLQIMCHLGVLTTSEAGRLRVVGPDDPVPDGIGE